MKKLLTSVFLLILGLGQAQSQDSHPPKMKAGSKEGTASLIDRNGQSGAGRGGRLSCASNGDDYLLLGDGRIVPNGPTPGANDAIVTLPVGKWHSGAKLLGLFDLDAGKEEAVLSWDTETTEGWDHHFQVFTGQRERGARLLREFTLTGAQVKALSVCRPPKGPDTPKMMIDIQGGAYWGTTYLLMPDGLPVKLFNASSYEFVDLNQDGIYELVAWDWHAPSVGCNISMFGAGPTIYAPSTTLPGGVAYRQVWPVEGGPFQIKGLFATLEGERTLDLVTLTNRRNKGVARYGPQYLALYRLPSRAKAEPPWPPDKAMQLVTRAEIPSSQIAFYLSSEIGPGGERRFVVWYTDRHGCESGAGEAIGSDKFKAIYVFRKGRLQKVGTEALGMEDLKNAGQPLDRN